VGVTGVGVGAVFGGKNTITLLMLKYPQKASKYQLLFLL